MILLGKILLCTTVVLYNSLVASASSGSRSNSPSDNGRSRTPSRENAPTNTEVRFEAHRGRVPIQNSPLRDGNLEVLQNTLETLQISKTDNIMIVGESTFSFSKMLALGLFITKDTGEERSMMNDPAGDFKKALGKISYYEYERPIDPVFYATSLTKLEDEVSDGNRKRWEMRRKKQIVNNISTIEFFQFGSVFRGIDATTLNDGKTTIGANKFDKIIWTFPYKPSVDFKVNPDKFNLQEYRLKCDGNQRLLMDFFKCVHETRCLRRNGEIHILLNQNQYQNWQIKKLLASHGKCFQYARDETIQFVKGDETGLRRCVQIPGYVATKTSGWPWESMETDCKWFVFSWDHNRSWRTIKNDKRQ